MACDRDSERVAEKRVQRETREVRPVVYKACDIGRQCAAEVQAAETPQCVHGGQDGGARA